jgi:hypothetical protein
MPDDDTRPLFARRNDSERHGAQSGSRAQVNRSNDDRNRQQFGYRFESHLYVSFYEAQIARAFLPEKTTPFDFIPF